MSEPTPVEIARRGLQGYIDYGARFWPCAKSFTLASLDVTGETDGGAADVCCGCVREVAKSALAAMNRPSSVNWHGRPGIFNLHSAVITCGPAPAYDITGSDDTHAAMYGGEHGVCAQCSEEIE